MTCTRMCHMKCSLAGFVHTFESVKRLSWFFTDIWKYVELRH
jgi:hypothetical protein